MFYVYVLFSKTHNKFYVGFTSNLQGRIEAHNHPKNKGWTKSFKPWILIYSEEFNSKEEAMKRELQLKSFQGRQFIKSIIEKM